MSRHSFGQEMQEVKNEVLLLASMVEEAVMESAQALKDNDLDRSRRVLQNDLRINRKRFEIEISIMVLIATQQPAAGDLLGAGADGRLCKRNCQYQPPLRGLKPSTHPEGYLFHGRKRC